jgi:hypothetical protein
MFAFPQGAIMDSLAIAFRPKLTPIEPARAHRQLRRLVCSAPWFDRCWAEVAGGRLKDRKRLDHALDRAAIYPPGGSPRAGQHRTLMRRCRQCGGRWHPPQYLRGCGLCEDCVAAIDAPLTDERNHVSTTASPTAEVLRQLAHHQVRLAEPRLPAEDEAALKREIAAYLRLHPDAASFMPLKNTKKH